MRTFTFTAALVLTTFSWSSGFSRVEVAPGEDAVLTCRNVSDKPADMFWARLINGNYSCIASNARKLCSGIRTDRFETSSNKSFVSLKIKNVTVDDSGFYFRGFNVYETGEIDLVQLSVEDFKSDEEPFESTVSIIKSDAGFATITGSVSAVCIVVIIGLSVRLCQLHKAVKHPPEERYKRASGDSVHVFTPTTLSSRRPPQSPEETHVIYTAIRESA